MERDRLKIAPAKTEKWKGNLALKRHHKKKRKKKKYSRVPVSSTSKMHSRQIQGCLLCKAGWELKLK